MNFFGFIEYDNTGLLMQTLYWVSGNRYFRRVIKGGVEEKAKRISTIAFYTAFQEYVNS